MNKKVILIIFKFKDLIISNKKCLEKSKIATYNFHQQKIIMEVETLINFNLAN